MRTSTLPALALLTGLLGASLTGCAVGITDPSETSEAPSSVTATPDEAETDETADGDDDTSQDAGDTAARADVRSKATTTEQCDGALTLEQAGAIISVEGDCEHLTVNADGSTIVAGDVATLEVVGMGNVVYTDALTMLTVSGDANVVHWAGAKPAITDDGIGNALTAG